MSSSKSRLCLARGFCTAWQKYSSSAESLRKRASVAQTAPL
jgi:hypothetical protein